MFDTVKSKLIGDGIALIPGANFIVGALRCGKTVKTAMDQKDIKKIQEVHSKVMSSDAEKSQTPSLQEKQTKHLVKEGLCGIALMIPVLGPICVALVDGLSPLLSKKESKADGIDQKTQTDKLENPEIEFPEFIPPENGNEDFFGFKTIAGFKTKLAGGYVLAENMRFKSDSEVKTAKMNLENICKKGNKEEIAKLPEKQELIKLNTQEYKIHLMPKHEDMGRVIKKLVDELESDPVLKNHVAQYKVMVGAKDDPKSILKFDDRKGYYPKIVIYAESKEAGEAILNSVYNLFKEDAEKIGDPSIAPRYNQKINSLIYYAQGSADIKNAAKNAGIVDQLFEEDLVHFKGGTPQEHALQLQP